ncbi:MAG: hypothetical protein ACYC6Y_24700 [Thermoguttaceae bacterium]
MRLPRTTTARNARRPSGTTLLEVVAAGAILGALIVACMQMLGRAALQQQAIANRRAALQAAANAMERAAALPWHELTAAGGERIVRELDGQPMPRGANLKLVVDPSDSPMPARRVRVVVTWRERNDGAERRQELVAWRFAEEPQQGPDPTPGKLPTMPEARP